MMSFSIGIGLELIGVVGPDLESSLDWSVRSGRWTSLQKVINKGDR